MERKAFEERKGIRDKTIARSTPMIDVLGVMPKVVRICMPMTAPTTDSNIV